MSEPAAAFRSARKPLLQRNVDHASYSRSRAERLLDAEAIEQIVALEVLLEPFNRPPGLAQIAPLYIG